MELTVTISSPVGEFTPDKYIGDNWKQIFEHFSSDPKDNIEKLQIEQFEEDEEGCPDNKISHFLVSYIETVEIIH